MGQEGDGLEIYQSAYFYLADLGANQELSYIKKNENSGLFLFNIKGNFDANGESLGERDALMSTEIRSLDIRSKRASQMLLIDVPMIEI